MISLLTLIFPTFCGGCGKLGSFLCSDCYGNLEFLVGDVKVELPTHDLEKVQAAVYYQAPIDKLLYQLKYGSTYDIGDYCGQLLFETVDLPQVDVITFIPLHKAKQRARGFNQAQVIAEALAHHLDLPCLPLLTRNRQTQTQAHLQDNQERLINISGAFALNPTYSSIPHLPQRILLVDDVVTTGSTLNEAARILRHFGAKKIYGVAVAHGQ